MDMIEDKLVAEHNVYVYTKHDALRCDIHAGTLYTLITREDDWYTPHPSLVSASSIYTIVLLLI